jgi:hypothetical protein
VPIEETVKAVEQLHAMRAPVEFARLPSGDHFEYHLVIAELRTKVCPWLEAVMPRLSCTTVRAPTPGYTSGE